MIFCLGVGKYELQGEGYQKNYRAWNKDITEDRYEKILKEVKDIFKDWKPEWKGGSRQKEWLKVRASQWAKLAQIPEFDLEVTKGITGLSNIPVEEEKTIEIEGKKFTVDQLKSFIKSANLNDV